MLDLRAPTERPAVSALVLEPHATRTDNDTAGLPCGPLRIAETFLHPINAFCVTVFNEAAPAVACTLRSLLESLRHFHTGRSQQSRFSLICLIADGVGALNTQVKSLLESCNLIVPRTCVQTNEAEYHCTLQGIAGLLARLHGLTEEPIEDSEAVRVIICLNWHNAGKLHSHHIFFNTICRQVHPDYCYQVDAGTALAHDAVSRLVGRLEQDPTIAAVAPRVIPDVPAPFDDFLQAWQYSDFALRQAVWWPFEVLTGHLSVIPGQTGVFRWQALHHSQAGTRTEGREPIDAYLRGLHATAAMDRLMFLTEDRVIGAEIVLAEGSRWKLDYLPEASAITDSCETFPELLRQRRRWNNSSMACRLWFIGRWPALRGRSRSGGGRSFILPIAAQMLLALREIFLPAQLLALAAVLLIPLSGTHDATQRFVHGAFWAIIALEVLLTVLYVRRPAAGLRAIRCALAYMSAALFVWILFISFSGFARLVLLTPLLTLLAMMLVLPARAFPTLLRMQLSPISHLVMSCVLSFYATSRLHDVSWGTKGLTQSATQASTARRLRLWRNAAVPIWLALNAAAVAGAVLAGPFLSSSLNIVVELTYLVEGIATLIALYLILHRHWSR